eukprot:1159566-Pelagomonas_calceolata.AAC.28
MHGCKPCSSLHQPTIPCLDLSNPLESTPVQEPKPQIILQMEWIIEYPVACWNGTCLDGNPQTPPSTSPGPSKGTHKSILTDSASAGAVPGAWLGEPCMVLLGCASSPRERGAQSALETHTP